MYIKEYIYKNICIKDIQKNIYKYIYKHIQMYIYQNIYIKNVLNL